MIVTEILELSKGRYKVFIDQEFSFVLYKRELQLYKIQCGQDIEEDTVRIITQEILPKRAKLRCMNLLKSRDYTRHQLYTKLKQGMYPETVIEEALEYVASFHYIDDLRYVKSYIQYAHGNKSQKKIEQDLMQKGIKTDIIQKALDEFYEEHADCEEDLIRQLLIKKHYSQEESTWEEKRKIVNYLYRKGFSLEKIYTVMGKID